MKYFAVLFSLLFFLSIGAQNTSYYPQPIGFVSDFEKDFSPDDVKALNLMVKQLLVKTMERDSLKGIEIALVTVTDSMFGNTKEMSDYAQALADKWGVGSKPYHRGIVIAYGQKIRKVAIVAGTGLDKILPPVACKDIVNQKMSAEFKKGDPYQALVAAVDGIAQYLGISLK